MFCRRCWIDFTASENYVVCAGPCAWPYHATCANLSRDMARELATSSSSDFATTSSAGLEWYCRNCRQLYRLQLYFEIAICDDYSLPVDFVKKRPSSFDPCLAEAIPTNPEHWIAPSPQTEFACVKLIEGYSDPKDTRHAHPHPHPHSHAHGHAHVQHKKVYHKKAKRRSNSSGHSKRQQQTLPTPRGQQQQQQQQQQLQLHKLHSQQRHSSYNNNNAAAQSNNKAKRSSQYNSDSSAPKSSDEEADIDEEVERTVVHTAAAAAASAATVANQPVALLNSPDSISDDLVRPLPPQLQRSPRKLIATLTEHSKRQPSPYYYSDLLKSRDKDKDKQLEATLERETKQRSRQSTASEPPAQPSAAGAVGYRKSSSLDAPQLPELELGLGSVLTEQQAAAAGEEEEQQQQQQEDDEERDNKRYSFTEDGVRIIRCECETPSTSTSEESDCSECIKRRQWHARALALVRKTCNVQPRPQALPPHISSGELQLQLQHCDAGEGELLKSCPPAPAETEVGEEVVGLGLGLGLGVAEGERGVGGAAACDREEESMPPHRLLGPAAVCGACIPTLPKLGNEQDLDAEHEQLEDYFRPRSIFYVHAHGLHECSECKPPPPPPPATSAAAATAAASTLVGQELELEDSDSDNMASRRRQLYETAFDCKIANSGGSMESLRSSTSEGNRSTSSCESRHSSSLSSHSSESGNNSASGSNSNSSSLAFPLRAPQLLHSKLHILSPISDKSSQEPASEQSAQQPIDGATSSSSNQQHFIGDAQQQLTRGAGGGATVAGRAPNKALLQLADELLGSDSGISLHSREDGKPQASSSLALQRLTLPKLQLTSHDAVKQDANGAAGSTAATLTAAGAGAGAAAAAGGATTTANALAQELRDLPFDMPKLRRRKTLLQQQEAACTSGSATSVDLGELPFDMPKLRRRLRANQAEINNLMHMHSTESSGISQASSSHSMRGDEHKLNSKLDTALFRQNLTLNLNEPRQTSKQFGSLDLRGLSSHKELNMSLGQGYVTAVDLIDVAIPLERQGWYHGAITRVEAETTLRPLAEGSFLVRNCESTKQDYSLSLKGAKGFMHMRIQRNESGQYILGQFSRPFDTVPEMIRHFCLNRLPVRGAEHMCLIEPVIAQLL
ncbi:CG43921 [Drosophila busckii]|uniref:SH2 domain-containing adapter protein D n=1 Tax=Drosophila busckii TaxID=30019 RepID=A0A0M3QZC9_DROBS|nr:CG43921 [Drosophila busckii]